MLFVVGGVGVVGAAAAAVSKKTSVLTRESDVASTMSSVSQEGLHLMG